MKDFVEEERRGKQTGGRALRNLPPRRDQKEQFRTVSYQTGVPRIIHFVGFSRAVSDVKSHWSDPGSRSVGLRLDPGCSSSLGLLFVLQMHPWDLSPFTVTPAARLLSGCVSVGAVSQVNITSYSFKLSYV